MVIGASTGHILVARLLPLSVLMAAFATAAWAQPMQLSQTTVDAQNVLGLQAAVHEAVLTHPLLRTARGQLQEADEGIAQAKAGYYPQISGGISSNVRSFDNDGYGSRHVHQATVSASQMLYDFGKVRNEVGNAQAQRDVARARVFLAVDELARSTAQAWLEVHRQQALADVAQEQLAQMNRLADLVAEREASGASPRSDRVQSQARVEQARVDLVTAQARMQQWRTTLRHLTGRNSLPEIGGEPPAVLAAACARVLNDDGAVRPPGMLPDLADPPAVQAAQAELAAARAMLDFAQAQSLPTLALEASANQPLTSGSRRNGRDGPEATVGLSFSAPLYQGGRMQSRQRAAEHALTTASAALEQVRLEVSQSLQSAAVQWQEHTQRARVQALRIESLEATRELYRQQYLQLGTRTLLDLLNAEQEYHGARSAAVDSAHEVYRQSLECLYQTGRLREALEVTELAAQAARLAEQR